MQLWMWRNEGRGRNERKDDAKKGGGLMTEESRDEVMRSVMRSSPALWHDGEQPSGWGSPEHCKRSKRRTARATSPPTWQRENAEKRKAQWNPLTLRLLSILSGKTSPPLNLVHLLLCIKHDETLSRYYLGGWSGLFSTVVDTAHLPPTT